MDTQEIQDIAIAEILNPTFSLTRQFLATNKLVYEHNTPIVADVIIREDENKCAEVYFLIEDESYYFVVYVDIEPHPSVRFMGTSPGNRVYFFAISEEHDLQELLAQISIEPTSTQEKGRRIRYNSFKIQPYQEQTGEVEDKLATLIKLLLPHKTEIQALSTIASVGVNVAYWGYKEQMWGINFDRTIIQGLAALNLSIDVDLYASGPALEYA